MAHDRHPLFLNPPSRGSSSPLYRIHDLPPPNSMAPLASLQDANNRILKRSFTADATNPPLDDHPTGSSSENKWARIPGARLQRVPTRPSDSGHRRKRSYTNMPSAAGPRMYENHIPSFMSIYDMDASLIENPNLHQLSTKPLGTNSTTYPDHQTHANLQTELSEPQESDHRNTIIHHQHHESISTTSDSTDSSPTTTISTVDSSSLSDPSPSSSPESPVTLVPLSSFAGSTFGDSFHGFKMSDNNLMRPSFSHERPMTSPSPRKFKNPKSLALNLNPLQPSSEPQQTSEPSSPSFIKPPPLKARKKPSLLSLNTGPDKKLSLEPLASPSVPTMLQRRGLKHSISSPQILATPGLGPSGGMTLGKPKPLGPSRFKDLSLSTKTFTITEDSHEAPTGVQMATRVAGVSVGGDSFDRPHTGEDAKSASYPEGPILMHEPSVHLYSEPNVDEALNFDVIINVAREVKNPFVVADAAKKPQSCFPSSISEPASTLESAPNTAMSFASFRTAFEMQPSGSSESSPTTPKASLDVKRPEYVHIPWDHNTDVKDELWDLCQLIESRTKEGKKVLVHCQQGASRSATLIIAYGMYINKDMSATDAYALAQSKSRWVNPNMSLLFSLNDFKKVIDERKKGEVDTTPNFRKPQTRHRPTLSAVITEAPPTPSRARGNSTPGTARDTAVARPDDSPIPTHSAIERLGSFDFGFDQMSINSPQQQRENKAPAPVARVLPPPHRRAPEPPISNMDELVRPSFQQSPRAAFSFQRLHKPEPPRATITEFPRPSIGHEYEELMSPRISEMTNNPLQSFSRSFATTEEEAPPSPSLFSPRLFEFPRNAFFPQETQAPPPPPKTVDPRSPPMKGEAPITRSIDDVL